MVGAQAIIGDIVPPRERGRYMGLIGAVFAVASVAGPLLGGFFVDSLSWRWVFYVNMPIGAVALTVVALKLHLPRRRTEHQVDYLGAALLTAGVSSVILLTTWGGNEYAWGSPTIFGLGALGLMLLAAFGWQERRAEEPIIPLSLFSSRVFSVASGLAFLVGLGMFGTIIFIPLYLQLVYGASATSSGLRMLPLIIGLLVASIASGRTITRIGRYRPFPIAGTFVVSIGMFLLSLLTASTPSWVASLYMLVVGVGLGLVMQVLILAVQNDATPGTMGVATASATFFRSIGGSFGVAIFGTIFASRLADQLRHLPASVTSHLSGGVHLDPAQAKRLPPASHEALLHAFANALHGVFLFGLGFMAGVRPLLGAQGGAAPREQPAARRAGRLQRCRGRSRRPRARYIRNRGTHPRDHRDHAASSGSPTSPRAGSRRRLPRAAISRSSRSTCATTRCRSSNSPRRPRARRASTPTRRSSGGAGRSTRRTASCSSRRSTTTATRPR